MEEEAIHPPPPSASAPTPMLSLTTVSPKKVQPDFNVAQYYNSAGGGRKSPHRSVQSAIAAAEAAGGEFEQAERVIRWARNLKKSVFSESLSEVF